jgi:hypothetical protein
MRIAFPYMGETTYIDDVPAWVCCKCAEQYFDAPVYERLEAIAKRRNSLRKTITFPLGRYTAAAAHVNRPV